MNAKEHFQFVKKVRSATGGGPVEKLKAGEEDLYEEDLYEVFQDSAVFTWLNGFATSDNTNETYSAISEISSSEVAGPSYDIREMADRDVAEFENIRKKNRHVGGKRKCCDTVPELEREIQKGVWLYWKQNILETEHIGNRTYWKQNILETEHIGNRTYWKQNILETEHIGNRTYWKQNILETEHIGNRTYWKQNILETEHNVKEKELQIKGIELEKMKIELRTAQLMANNIDSCIENTHANRVV